MNRGNGKIILTGQRQVGKSTALNRFLTGYSGALAGFRTVFDNRDNTENRRLLLRPLPGGEPSVPVVWTEGKAQVDLSAFDRCVPPLLAQSADLYVLDELGKFEGGAGEMAGAVEALFDRADASVLAVVRLDAPGWMGALKERRDVTVLTVTEENRDSIPETLENLFKNE